MIRVLDLFSGIGGFALASQRVGGFATLAFCEIEDYCRKVLAKNFPNIPIFTDVRELHPTDVIPRDGVIHLITAGFPCQDLSIAGNQAGIEADRSGLFFQILRLSDEFYAYSRVRPSLLLENVPNLLTGNGGDWARTVYSELAVRGYRCEWKIISASDVGAPHLRKRWWCLAYLPYSKGLHGNVSNDHSRVLMEGQSISESGDRGRENDMAHTNEQGFLPHSYRKRGRSRNSKRQNAENVGQLSRSQKHRIRNPEPRLGGALPDGLSPWMDEPADLPRVTHEKKYRKQRLMSLGNSIVPQVAMIPLRRFKEIHESKKSDCI